MRLAATVTFGGSDLDRAAAERKDAGALARLLVEGGQVIALWRGKPLVAGDPVRMGLARW